MELLYKLKGSSNIILISDGIMALGLPDGIYPRYDGRQIIVEGGRAMIYGSTSGNLAGSVKGINEGIRNMMSLVGVPLTEAVNMASINPARRIGVDGRKGSLRVGKDADITVFESDFSAWKTFVMGREVYSQGNKG